MLYVTQLQYKSIHILQNDGSTVTYKFASVQHMAASTKVFTSRYFISLWIIDWYIMGHHCFLYIAGILSFLQIRTRLPLNIHKWCD